MLTLGFQLILIEHEIFFLTLLEPRAKSNLTDSCLHSWYVHSLLPDLLKSLSMVSTTANAFIGTTNDFSSSLPSFPNFSSSSCTSTCHCGTASSTSPSSAVFMEV